MSGTHLIAKNPSTPFLAECHEFVSMEVTIVVDGVHMKIGCKKFEVLNVEEINFMTERRAKLAAQKAAASSD